MDNKEAFLGQGWNFPPAFFNGGANVALVSGEEDIRQSLAILLSTELRERVMFPNYGCDMSRYQFAEVDNMLINSIGNDVANAILLNEPRIVTNQVEVIQDNLESGVLLISVTYTVISTNTRYNLVYPFYINEASK